MGRNETNPPRNVTVTVRADQLDWVDGEAERLEAATHGVHVSRSAIVRRVIDEARERVVALSATACRQDADDGDTE